ncbi:hypothetical protein GCM10020219_099910 [Nonomuraea dietziae]
MPPDEPDVTVGAEACMSGVMDGTVTVDPGGRGQASPLAERDSAGVNSAGCLRGLADDPDVTAASASLLGCACMEGRHRGDPVASTTGLP